MKSRELLKALRSTLKQSYPGIYKVEEDRAQLTGEYTRNPAAVLQRIRERTLEFEETDPEQQQRADRVWDALGRPSVGLAATALGCSSSRSLDMQSLSSRRLVSSTSRASS